MGTLVNVGGDILRSTKPPLNSGGTRHFVRRQALVALRSTKPPLNSGGTRAPRTATPVPDPTLNEAPAKQRRNRQAGGPEQDAPPSAQRSPR